MVCGGKKWILIVFGTLITGDIGDLLSGHPNNSIDYLDIVAACVAFVPLKRLGPDDFLRRYDLTYFLLALFSSSIVVTGVGTFLIIF